MVGIKYIKHKSLAFYENYTFFKSQSENIKGLDIDFFKK